jgi:cob(I)alamin adenosyltransferase
MKKASEQPRLIHIYTGPSKGKTTASVGLAVRAVGAGWKVLYCSFFKPDGSSEHESLVKLGVTLKRFSWRGTFFKKYTPEEMEEQRQALRAFLTDIESDWKKYDLVVMDEIVYAVTSNVISEKDFLSFLDCKPATVELVLTGRDFPSAIASRADYISTMEQTKHPFDSGFLPRKGIEY